MKMISSIGISEGERVFNKIKCIYIYIYISVICEWSDPKTISEGL